MSQIKTYPEMNETIKDLLRRSEEPMQLYILARIEELEKQISDLTPPPNEPLTLDELREMDGEPVWCVDGRGNQCWCLVNCDDGLPCCYDNETGLWEDCFYGMTGDGRFGLHQSGWLAYRSKPEEGTNAVT